MSVPKPFQQKTAQAAIRTLDRPTGARRFLVADEVGLGKTVVAQEVIRGLMRGRRRPLVVLYFASNLSIAHQNRSKLLEVLDDRNDRPKATGTADRLTLVALTRQVEHHRLNLYTFTPETSIPLGRGRVTLGRMEERALLRNFLFRRYPSLVNDLPDSMFQGRARKRWVEHADNFVPVEDVRGWQLYFLKALRSEFAWPRGVGTVEGLRSEARRLEGRGHARLLARLRSALAVAAIEKLRPDLVIFDEFQKFREVLIDSRTRKGTTDRVTMALRGDGHPRDPALLLLSATPYRLYSTRGEDLRDESHHREFFELIGFLFGASGSRKRPAIEAAFEKFRTEMERPELDTAALIAARDRIQWLLRPVMSRTERPTIGEVHSGLSPKEPISSHVNAADLRVFTNFAWRLRNGKQPSKQDTAWVSVPYWLSIPFPVQMMNSSYVAWRRANRTTRRPSEPVFRRGDRNALRTPRDWPSHPQLREMARIVPPKLLALPWIPPSLPWWELGGRWKKDTGPAPGKMLVFSRFRAAPPALASLMSFAMETEVARGSRNYERLGKARPLAASATRLPLLALFLPSPTIIRNTDPLRSRDRSLAAIKRDMRTQVAALLSRLKINVRREKRRLPLWRLIADIEQLTGEWADIECAWRRARRKNKANAGKRDVLKFLVNRWTHATREPLSFITWREVNDLAEYALCGPGVVLGRALYRLDPKTFEPDAFDELLFASWHGLREYLSNGWFQSMLTRRGQRFPDAILEAVRDGNLESVLDEHLWISRRLRDDESKGLASDLLGALGLRMGNHFVHAPGSRPFPVRCHAAMPFSGAQLAPVADVGEKELRTDQLRRAFNTPFWPHVLTTTSLGQEGLDFHVWCRRLLHWDLCSTPVDLEQREGRLQRFGALSIRAVLANLLGAEALNRVEITGSISQVTASPWMQIAELAEERLPGNGSGLSPWWICDGGEPERLFIPLRHSRQSAKYDELKRQRWFYRLALGQPHQEDFIERIERHADLRANFSLNLSAWSPVRCDSIQAGQLGK